MDYQGVIRVFSTIFLLSLFLYFPSQIEATFGSTNELLKNVCSQSDDNKECIHTLKSNPQIGSVSNLKGLTNAALEKAIKDSTATRNFFNSLMILDSNPKTQRTLRQCAKYFDEATRMFNLRGLEDGSASLDVHYALDNAEYCEKALKNANVHIGTIDPAIHRWKNSYSAAYATVLASENSQSP